jgi:hypothetical protein
MKPYENLPMNTSRKPSPDRAPAGSGSQGSSRGARQPKERQPAATGANRGSPAASVMKQFAKTKAEGGGRS